ncbi:hypothetical protein BOTBODRAFT_59105 [Botryobasidium botryosum FD-172 SS1]|uniref:Prefoldin subunit 2 n=1 Tax=Botryobasidium botryosum (strain FD-172 SS1) TaxID=930990 RepID=A0A067MBE4_BOTB1|nr:hypothetical protein BOTBODRAFT_59105 [Botryobasidium botryosum FD-172 SS1]
MASSAVKQKSTAKKLTNQEVQNVYSRYQTDLQTLAQKIGELESEADEHELVLTTLLEALETEPDRKCFRLIGGVLVERTVKDVVPSLRTNRDGIKGVLTTLVEQYKKKEEEFQSFTREYGIRPGAKA